MPLTNMDYIRHIYDEAIYIANQTSQLEFDDLVNDETLKRAIIRSIEIIGEASKKLSPEFKDKYPSIDWRAMSGMRDKLIHDYFGIDYDIVWDVIKNEIPKLMIELENILQDDKS